MHSMVFPLATFFKTFQGYFCFAFGPSISHIRLVGGNKVVGDQGKWWERRAVTLGDERYARWSMRTLPALPALPAGTALLSTFVYDCCPVCCVDKHSLNSVYLLRALWKNDCSFGSLRQGPIFIWDDILCPWVFDPGLQCYWGSWASQEVMGKEAPLTGGLGERSLKQPC